MKYFHRPDVNAAPTHLLFWTAHELLLGYMTSVLNTWLTLTCSMFWHDKRFSIFHVIFVTKLDQINFSPPFDIWATVFWWFQTDIDFLGLITQLPRCRMAWATMCYFENVKNHMVKEQFLSAGQQADLTYHRSRWHTHAAELCTVLQNALFNCDLFHIRTGHHVLRDYNCTGSLWITMTPNVSFIVQGYCPCLYYRAIASLRHISTCSTFHIVLVRYI